MGRAMIITTVPSNDGLGLYTAVSSAGQVIAERTHSPLLDSARAMMAQSTALSTHALEMWHSGSTAWALRGKIGQCAKLEVTEGPHGPFFRPYRPRQIEQGCVVSSCS